MAMKIGGKYDPNEVYLRHWHRLVPDTAVARKAIEKSLADIARTALDEATKLHTELNKDGITSPVLDSILALIKRRSTRLKP